ncbi:MAG: hypothetical protein N3A01_01425 [Bacteroidales bacterium]|nr:hypothetical protein [Bacteroidales bacterium]
MKTIFLVILLLFYSSVYSYTGKKIKELNSPGRFPSGITFDGKNLWIADWKDDVIYSIDTSTGKILKKIQSPGYWPAGLAFNNGYLWCTDLRGGIPMFEYYIGKVFKINLTTGDIEKIVSPPSNSPLGLTYDGKYLWCTDNKSDMIFQFDPEDGTIINSFKSPSSDPNGIAFDGNYLWVTDRIKDEIYMIDPASGMVIFFFDAPGPYASSICFDGQNLWVTDIETKKIYKLKLDEEKYTTFNTRKVKVSYIYTVCNFGPNVVKEYNVFYACPQSTQFQKIKNIKFSVKNVEFLKDKWNQKIAKIKLTDIKPLQKIELSMDVEAEISSVRYFVYPHKVGNLNTLPDSVKIYLKNDDKYRINDTIITNIVKKIVANEKNPYWIARKLYNYVIEKLDYEMAGGWDIAPTILKRGTGSCSEYTFSYIALCRAAGIPARYVGSLVMRGDEVSIDNTYHRWAEIYLPEYGWIPVDANAGDSSSPRTQAEGFGYLPNKFLITTQSGGGSEYLEWSYNSNESYVTEPKTHVIFEHFAEWETLK